MQIDIRSTTNLTNVDNSVDCSCRFYLIWALVSSLFAAYLWYDNELTPKPVVDNASSIMFVTNESLSVQQKLVANSQVIQQYCDSNGINFRVYPANAETKDLEPWAAVMLTEGSKHPPCLVKYDGSTVEVLNVPSTIEEAMEQIK
jgi:hypothetical protein